MARQMLGPRPESEARLPLYALTSLSQRTARRATAWAVTPSRVCVSQYGGPAGACQPAEDRRSSDVPCSGAH